MCADSLELGYVVEIHWCLRIVTRMWLLSLGYCWGGLRGRSGLILGLDGCPLGL